MVLAAASRLAKHRAEVDVLATVYRCRREERVRGAQVAAVRDHDMHCARDDSRERDNTGTGRVNRGARCGSVIDAEMLRAERARRRREPAQNRPIDRWAPRGTRRREGGCGHDGASNAHDNDNHECERDAHDRARWHRTLPGRETTTSGKERGKSSVSDAGAGGGEKPEVLRCTLNEGCDSGRNLSDRQVTIPRSGSGSERRPRNWKIAFVWIWQTRLSVTPSTAPISASVRPS
jgi:hypothetical protein